MHPVDRLLLDLRIPPRIDEIDRLRHGEVQPDAAGLERDEERGIVAGTKLVDDGGAVGGRAIEVLRSDARPVGSVAGAGEKARELAEDERPVPLGGCFDQ